MLVPIYFDNIKTATLSMLMNAWRVSYIRANYHGFYTENMWYNFLTTSNLGTSYKLPWQFPV